jgi:dienelactone hydrolase
MANLRRVLAAAAGAVDRAAVAAMQAHGARGRARAESMSHGERLDALGEIAAGYPEELIAQPARFFEPPPVITPTLTPVREMRAPRATVEDAAWPSEYRPYLDALAERWGAFGENRVARARLFRRDGEGRPAVVAVHGYLGGQWLIEESQWPLARWLWSGLDVALPLLPFHGRRASPRRGAPPFPGADPRMNVEGFRQAVSDIRALVGYLRARGAPHVGVVGVSLGGYTSSLLATVAPEIDFVMPMIPLASVADFARDRGSLGSGAAADAQHAALERAHRVVSPLARPLLLPPSRALVVAAAQDGITPARHAKRIRDHFGCAELSLAGGHIVQLDRRAAFRALGEMLAREGIIARSSRRRAPPP